MNDVSKVSLLSLATALPGGTLSQSLACEKACGYNTVNERQEKVLHRLYSKTQIDHRRTIFNPAMEAMSEFYPDPRLAPNRELVSPGTEARMQKYRAEITPLAHVAAQNALIGAGISAAQIANLVTVSCTGFFAPGLDTELIELLALPRSVSRTNVGFMGCHGALNGLRVGSALTKASRAPSLVVAAELCSLHFQYGIRGDDILANALFADGAGAAVLGFCEDFNGGEEAVGECSGKEIANRYRLADSISYLLPESAETMTWRITDHGFAMTLSPQVSNLIEQNLLEFVTGWLGHFNLTIQSIKSWAIHPGGPRILDAVQTALKLNDDDLEPSRHIFRNLGNMSSPTILFIIERLSGLQHGGPMVAMAFGPGLTIEAALFI